MGDTVCNVQYVTNSVKRTYECRKPATRAYLNQKTGEVSYRCIKHEKGFALMLKAITFEEALVREVMTGYVSITSRAIASSIVSMLSSMSFSSLSNIVIR